MTTTDYFDVKVSNGKHELFNVRLDDLSQKHSVPSPQHRLREGYGQLELHSVRSYGLHFSLKLRRHLEVCLAWWHIPIMSTTHIKYKYYIYMMYNEYSELPVLFV